MTHRGQLLALLGVLAVAAALRLPGLDRIPNGLIPDEALSAYDAFSIAKTGRDAYGEPLPVFPRSTARLHSLYIYLAVPFVAAHGLDEWSARLPSALAGVVTVALVFLLLRDAHGLVSALAAAALLAVSPWHVLMSRTGHDWNMLPAMAALTAWLVTRALTRGASFWPAAWAAGLSFYTYTPMRLWMPLLLGLIALTHAQELRRQWRRAWPAAVLALSLALPPFVAMAVTDEGRQRISAVVATQKGEESAPVGFLRRFVSSFSPAFLLAPASEPALHRLRSMGLLYGFEAVLALFGGVVCLATRDRKALLPVLALLAAPLAVSMHRDAPDPILGVVMLPWLQSVGGVGAGWLAAQAVRFRGAPLVVASAFVALWAAAAVARASFDLYREFPVYAARAWGYGAREAVATLEGVRTGHDDVIVDTGEKLLSSLILFYSRYDPRSRQAEVKELPGRAERSRVGVYRVTELAQAEKPGRHLAWTTADRARRLRLPLEATPIARIPFPDGSDHYVLLRVSRARGAP